MRPGAAPRHRPPPDAGRAHGSEVQAHGDVDVDDTACARSPELWSGEHRALAVVGAVGAGAAAVVFRARHAADR